METRMRNWEVCGMWGEEKKGDSEDRKLKCFNCNEKEKWLSGRKRLSTQAVLRYAGKDSEEEILLESEEFLESIRLLGGGWGEGWL